MLKQFLLTSILLSSFLSSTVAIANTAMNIEKNAQQLLQSMIENLESDLIAHNDQLKKDPVLTSSILQKHLLGNVHFPIMSRYVLGKNWNKLNKVQKDKFLTLFQQLLVRFYTKIFIEYTQKNQIEKGMISFLPYYEKSNSKYSRVKTSVKLSNNSPKTRVNYSMYKTRSNGWKVYDISIEGISLVKTYQASFNSIIKKESVDALLAHLQQKVDQLNNFMQTAPE